MALEPGTKRSIGKDQTVRSGREELARAATKLPEATREIHTHTRRKSQRTNSLCHSHIKTVLLGHGFVSRQGDPKYKHCKQPNEVPSGHDHGLSNRLDVTHVNISGCVHPKSCGTAMEIGPVAKIKQPSCWFDGR